MSTPSAADSLAFLTPYWSGREMMEIHLRSLRRFHPDARILVSKRGGDRDEMEGYAATYGVEFWLEECSYTDAFLRLLDRCDTRYACVIDHDAVLLSGLDPYLRGLAEDRYDLIGVEERIIDPPSIPWQRLRPQFNGWWRLTPGSMDATLLLFDWRKFRARWGLRGVVGRGTRPGQNHEPTHGIPDRLVRHHYLRPFHVPRYGVGNLLMDGATPVAWHQWYGAYRTGLSRGDTYLSGGEEMVAILEQGERSFLNDYPAPDFTGASPAWGEGREAEIAALLDRPALPWTARVAAAVERVVGWRRYGFTGIASRVWSQLDRWRRYL